jgi:hypothetical protein
MATPRTSSDTRRNEATRFDRLNNTTVEPRIRLQYRVANGSFRTLGEPTAQQTAFGLEQSHRPAQEGMAGNGEVSVVCHSVLHTLCPILLRIAMQPPPRHPNQLHST